MDAVADLGKVRHRMAFGSIAGGGATGQRQPVTAAVSPRNRNMTVDTLDGRVNRNRWRRDTRHWEHVWRARSTDKKTWRYTC